MKYLVASIIVLTVLLPGTPLANDKFENIIWGAGEPIGVQALCADEDTMIDIVNADMKSEELVIDTINLKVAAGACMTFPNPIMLFVQNRFLSYKDHSDRYSVALKVMNGFGRLMGYCLAPGRFDKNKKSPKQKVNGIPT